jgi:rubredoxin
MALIAKSDPHEFYLDDLFNHERWMCSKCGLIFDYKFDPEFPGWPDFDPPYSIGYPWFDEEGNSQFEEPDREETCPRCGLAFKDSPLITLTIREVSKLSDFFRHGDGEDVSLEFKEQFSTDRIRHTMAAFASTKGGKIILGINNKGEPTGYKEERLDTTEGKDKLRERIRGLTKAIRPIIKYQVYFVDDDCGNHFAVILVPKGPALFYSASGKCYTREMDESRPLSIEEMNEMANMRKEKEA